jgi:hypothetical protein
MKVVPRADLPGEQRDLLAALGQYLHAIATLLPRVSEHVKEGPAATVLYVSKRLSPRRLGTRPRFSARVQYTADLRQFRIPRGCISSRGHFKTSPSTSTCVRLRPRGSLDRCSRSRW